jgi:AbrB family looped-hinge helix DNA binding protein
MAREIRVSTKGQIVLPKDVRDRLCWSAGETLEVVEHMNAVTLRLSPRIAPTAPHPKDVFARISARNTYRGARISDDDIVAAVRDTVMRNDGETRAS